MKSKNDAYKAISEALDIIKKKPTYEDYHKIIDWVLHDASQVLPGPISAFLEEVRDRYLRGA